MNTAAGHMTEAVSFSKFLKAFVWLDTYYLQTKTKVCFEYYNLPSDSSEHEMGILIYQRVQVLFCFLREIDRFLMISSEQLLLLEKVRHLGRG